MCRNRASHSEKYPQSCSVTQRERDSDASNESDASDTLQRSGAGARQSHEAASINERNDAGRRATATARTKMTKCTAHRAPVRAVAECYLVDRGGAIRSGTWPASWCRSAHYQPFLHPDQTREAHTSYAALQPQPTLAQQPQPTAAVPLWHFSSKLEDAALPRHKRSRAAAQAR